MTDLVTVKEIDARKGRGIIANVDLPVRTVVYSVFPDLVTLYSQFVPHTCVVCFRRDLAVQDCPRCRQFAVCQQCSGTAYGKQRQEAHTQPCEWITLLPEETQRGDTDYLRFVLEYCSRVQNGDTRLLMAMDNLCTNEDSTAPDVKQFCDSFSRLVTTKFQEHGLLVAQPQIRKLLMQTKSNSIGFPFNDRDTLGWALQEEVCMLNHSCSPNCAVGVGAKGEIVVKTIKPVEADEELTISYVDLSGPLGADVGSRTRHLLHQYRFLCHCELCQEQRKEMTKQ